MTKNSLIFFTSEGFSTLIKIGCRRKLFMLLKLADCTFQICSRTRKVDCQCWANSRISKHSDWSSIRNAREWSTFIMVIHIRTKTLKNILKIINKWLWIIINRLLSNVKKEWVFKTIYLTTFRPENGVIEFDNYATRYREGLDLVLKGEKYNAIQWFESNLCRWLHGIIR